MARSSRSRFVAALTFIILFAAGVSMSGHRRDEFLQAARIAIDPDRVRIDLDLTPGISVADAVLSDIDRDRDGSISATEGTAYLGRVMGALTLEIDDTPLVPHVTGSTFAPVGTMRNGEGTIHIQFAAALSDLPAGPHHLSFRNAHRPDVSVYLANAVVPESDRVAVTNQERDYDQRILDVDYVLRKDRQGGWWRAEAAAAGLLVMIGFIVQRRGTS
jgi:hypothetical protein